MVSNILVKLSKVYPTWATAPDRSVVGNVSGRTDNRQPIPTWFVHEDIEAPQYGLLENYRQIDKIGQYPDVGDIRYPHLAYLSSRPVLVEVRIHRIGVIAVGSPN